MIKSFITVLGGPKATAAALQSNGHNVKEKAVVAWSMRNRVPWKWRQAMAELAIQRDIEALPPEIEKFRILAAAE